MQMKQLRPTLQCRNSFSKFIEAFCLLLAHWTRHATVHGKIINDYWKFNHQPVVFLNPNVENKKCVHVYALMDKQLQTIMLVIWWDEKNDNKQT